MILKRSTIKNAQKLFHASIPMKMDIYDVVAVYENQDITGYTRFFKKLKKKSISNNCRLHFSKEYTVLMIYKVMYIIYIHIIFLLLIDFYTILGKSVRYF